MNASPEKQSHWGSTYRLIAAEKWKAKSAAMGKAVTAALVDYAGPEPGMNVLDVASGTGEPAISVAKRVAPEGHVTALDLSSELLDIATQRAQQRGLANFSVQQADAQQLPFPDRSFDLITCRFGVMFFPDVDRALKEAHRVLKPGGRACFVAWGPFDQPYWSSTMGIVHRHLGGPLLAESASGMFRFAEPGSLSDALRHAGFVETHEELKQLPWDWPGPAEEVWEYAQVLSTPFHPLLDRIPADQRSEIDREVVAAIQRYVDGGTVKFGVKVVLASGRVGQS